MSKVCRKFVERITVHKSLQVRQQAFNNFAELFTNICKKFGKLVESCCWICAISCGFQGVLRIAAGAGSKCFGDGVPGFGGEKAIGSGLEDCGKGQSGLFRPGGEG